MPNPLPQTVRNIIRARLVARQLSDRQQLDLLAKDQLYHATIQMKLEGIATGQQWFNFNRCGKEELYRTCKCCGQLTKFSYRCDLKWCPLCQWRISTKRAEKIAAWAKHVSQPKHVVTTQRNLPILTATEIKKHTQRLAKLRRHPLARKITFWRCRFSEPQRGIADTGEIIGWDALKKFEPATPTTQTVTGYPWKGGCVSVEITNEGRGWHVHAHWLIDSRFIPAGPLALVWGELVGQEFGIVCVKDVRGKAFVQEICKYLAKGSEVASWPAEQIWEFVSAIRGKRFFFSFGSLFHQGADIRRELAAAKPPAPVCECGESDFIYETETDAILNEIRKQKRR